MSLPMLTYFHIITHCDLFNLQKNRNLTYYCRGSKINRT